MVFFPHAPGSCPWLSKKCKAEGLENSFVKSGESLATKYPQGCIYVLPLGEFPEESSLDFDSLVEYAKLFFCYNVKKLPTAKLEFDGENVYWIQQEDDDGSTKVIRKEELSSRCLLFCTLITQKHEKSWEIQCFKSTRTSQWVVVTDKVIIDL